MVILVQKYHKTLRAQRKMAETLKNLQKFCAAEDDSAISLGILAIFDRKMKEMQNL